MLNFTVDQELCTRCGLCAKDCPSQVIDQSGTELPKTFPAKESLCIQCQHCLAVCPAGAVSIFGKNPKDSLPLAAGCSPGLDQMTLFLRGRRSVRHYKDENVDPALLQKLLATLANVPTGVNRRELTFRVIDDKGVMQQFREKVMAAFVVAEQNNRIPSHLSYLLETLKVYKSEGRDVLFRGAPHALIVTAPKNAPCPNQDVPLALAYFDLLAQSAGLGTVWWGMLSMVLMALPEMGPYLGIPADHVYYAMLFGVPDIAYSRTVQRDEGAKIVRVKGL